MIRSPFLLGCLLAILAFTFVPIKHIDPSLKEMFERDYFTMVNECDKIELPIQFILKPDDIKDKGWVGVTTISGNRVIIRIDKTYMKQNSQDAIEVTLLHEMAHGFLGMDHNKDPGNYMYYSETGVPLVKAMEQFKHDVREKCNEL